MPDWFYRTVAQRVLFTLPDRVGRGLALGTIGFLGRTAAGRQLIDFLGHMRAPACLAVERAGLTFPSRVGLGRRIDPAGIAVQGLARFGVGFIEAGPVEVRTASRPRSAASRGPGQTIRVRGDDAAGDVAWWRRRLQRHAASPIPMLVRLAAPEAGPPLADLADAFILEPAADGSVPAPVKSRPCFLAVDLDAGHPRELLQRAHAAGFVGAVVDAEHTADNGERVVGRFRTDDWKGILDLVATARDVFDAEGLVSVTQAVVQPEDARTLIAAGADLVQVDTGLLFTGPGLCKRCNDALAGTASLDLRDPPPEATRAAWWWAMILGLALAGGGLLALAIALTRVVLPYDEHYLGLTREGLAALNPRLLDFMTHDRVTLAGTMIGLGVLYASLAWHGIRRGQHWAQLAVGASGLTGFLSFLSFLGFGYFDPFHAFVSASLLPLTLLALALPRGGERPETLPAERREDAAWRRAQWGQFLFVLHAVGLLAAGAIILGVGMTDVFVAEDLAFLCISAAQLQALNDHLIPVVAHDRASLGGMLLANGVCLLLAALWGFRRERVHVWWAFLATAAPAYVAALGIHLYVGYTDWRHLLPAIAGAVMFATALALTRGYLLKPAHAARA